MNAPAVVAICLFAASCTQVDDNSDEASGHLVLQPTRGATVECEYCSVVMEPIGALARAASETGGPLITSNVTYGADNRYYVVPTAEPGTIEVYDSSGRFERVIGRLGKGPGELMAPVAATSVPDGRVLVIDRGSRTSVALFSQAGAPLGGWTLPQVGAQDAYRSDVGLLLKTMDITPEGVVPAYLVTLDARMTALGLIHMAEAAINGIVHVQGEVCATGDTLWVIRSDKPILRAYDSQGRNVRELEVRGMYWQDGKRRTIGIVPADSLLAILTYYENPDFVPPANWDPNKPLTTDLLDKKVDTQIDLVSTRSGRVVTSATTDKAVRGRAGPNLIYTIEEQSDGALAVRVWRLKLQTARGPQTTKR